MFLLDRSRIANGLSQRAFVIEEKINDDLIQPRFRIPRPGGTAPVGRKSRRGSAWSEWPVKSAPRFSPYRGGPSGTNTPPHFRVIFVPYRSNLAYVTVFQSSLLHGFGYRLWPDGHRDSRGLRRSQNEGHSDRYRPRPAERIQNQDSWDRC